MTVRGFPSQAAEDLWDAICEDWLSWWFGSLDEAYEVWECFYWIGASLEPLGSKPRFGTTDCFECVMTPEAHAYMVMMHAT